MNENSTTAKVERLRNVPEPQVFEGLAWTCLPCLKEMPEAGHTYRLILCKDREGVLGCGGMGQDAIHVRYRIEVISGSEET